MDIKFDYKKTPIAIYTLISLAMQNGSWPLTTDGCNCAYNKGGCIAAQARVDGGGQTCLWFSQGCTIGCKECTGIVLSLTVTQTNKQKRKKRLIIKNQTGMNGHTSVSLCSDGMEPTLNEPQLRTMNRGAVAGSVNDTYRYVGYQILR